MVEKVIEFTKEGYAAKQAELDELRKVKRPEMRERLKDAIAYGDISENAEYDTAKNEQAALENRITELESELKYAKVIEDGVKTDVVRLGQKVKIRKAGAKDSVEYTIVSSSEADPINGKISNVSPVGAALIDKRVKDKVDVKLPDGVAKYEILSIG